MFLTSLISITVLILVHLFVSRLGLSGIPRSKWLSLGGGISVTYVFLHVLPEFAEYQEMYTEHAASPLLSFMEHHIYGFALLGLVAFYGLERAAMRSSQTEREPHNDHEEHDTRIFWIHMFSFMVYNGIIGYLLWWREDQSTLGLVYYVLAMAFHFMVTDFGLYEHYRELYRRRGRWLVVAALLGGWLLGLTVEIEEIHIGMIFAFVAGGIIMNVLKEELPEERKSNLWAFLTGVAVYAALLIAT
ncbi:zinc transporter ZupT [Lewinella marina]|uniref:ZIP Zinc transporter n=1 Tax=Neolewinella marina TaxID=438751 RepID=A0A2G0CC89_9BACT|nr:hypothetical protein [Neolewinella marina]NJB86776.1 zinc transporter ZupT [Neolewinella marina]PHK97581.1 hypothetical protein CGL56_15910 [Neolewinella marina]